MKQYNRALDYTVLALSELKGGNAPLAARLLAEAVKQSDINAAINILEASNKHAFALQAQAVAAAEAEEMMAEETCADMADPLDEVHAEEEEMAPAEEAPAAPAAEEAPAEESPEMEMAKVLSRMVRQAAARK